MAEARAVFRAVKGLLEGAHAGERPSADADAGDGKDPEWQARVAEVQEGLSYIEETYFTEVPSVAAAPVATPHAQEPEDAVGEANGAGGDGVTEDAHPAKRARRAAPTKPPDLKTCACGPGECWQLFDEDTLRSFRQQLAGLKRNERRLAVQLYLSSQLISPPWMHGYTRGDVKPSQKGWQDRNGRKKTNIRGRYRFFGVDLCQTGMCNALGIGRGVIENSFKDIKNGFAIPSPTNQGAHLRHQAEERHQKIVDFIEGMADKHAFPNPAGGGPRRLLPIAMSKRALFETFNKQTKERKTSESTFVTVWNRRLPHIGHARTRTDVCDRCSRYTLKQDVEALKHHLLVAEKERDFMREMMEYGANHDEAEAVSFGMAGITRLPHFLEQPQEYFFQSGLKVDIFGISDLVQKKQINYTWPETTAPSVRGSDLVVSLLRDFLKPYTAADFIYMMADNCTGEHKNATLLHFLCLFSIAHNTTVHLHFLRQGHTKGFHDGAFGLIKRALKKKDVFTPQQFMEVVQHSSKANTAKDGGTVPQHKFGDHLQSYFRKLPRHFTMKLSYHFRFCKDEPGVLFHKDERGDEWQRVRLLKSGVNPIDITPRVFDGAQELPRLELSEKRRDQLCDVRNCHLTGERAHLAEDFFPSHLDPPPKPDKEEPAQVTASKKSKRSKAGKKGGEKEKGQEQEEQEEEEEQRQQQQP